MAKKQFQIDSADGKLAVLLPGLGAVSTTFIAGVQAVLKGIAKPIGSLTQMGTIRLGKRTENRVLRGRRLPGFYQRGSARAFTARTT